MASIDPFARDYARIAAKLPRELAVPDIERDDAGRAPPQQHIGEAAGRSADVERAAARDIDLEAVKRMRKLDASAADIGMIGRDQFDLGSLPHERACFRHRLTVHSHLSRENHCAGALS